MRSSLGTARAVSDRPTSGTRQLSGLVERFTFVARTLRILPNFRIAGHDVDLTADVVRRRLKGVVPEPIQVWWVEIDAVRYPVVQVLEVASGIPRGQTRSVRAREVLAKL
jgi:hypothetical protein